MNVITLDQVLGVIPTLDPDRVNPRADSGLGVCVYTQGENHCIAGEILTRLDVPVPEAGSLYNRQGIRRLAKEYLQPNGYSFEEEALKALNILQRLADIGPAQWGEAIEDAKKENPDLFDRNPVKIGGNTYHMIQNRIDELENEVEAHLEAMKEHQAGVERSRAAAGDISMTIADLQQALNILSEEGLI